MHLLKLYLDYITYIWLKSRRISNSLWLLFKRIYTTSWLLFTPITTAARKSATSPLSPCSRSAVAFAPRPRPSRPFSPSRPFAYQFPTLNFLKLHALTSDSLSSNAIFKSPSYTKQGLLIFFSTFINLRKLVVKES